MKIILVIVLVIVTKISQTPTMPLENLDSDSESRTYCVTSWLCT